MDIRQLRQFLGVVEAGSFTDAARRLGVAQPALSQTVIALETDLGARLLERQPRGVRPTDSGLRLMEHARIILRDLERAREAVSDVGGPITGRVGIGLPSTVAPLLAVPLMRAAMKKLPGAAIHLVESHSGFLREWLNASRLDLAVLFNVPKTEALNIVPLVVEDLHWISAFEGERSAPDIRLRDIGMVDLIMAGRSHDLRDTLDEAYFLATKKQLTVAAEVDSVSTIKQMVVEGVGSTVLPLANVPFELVNRKVAARRIIRPTIERHASLVSLAHRPVTRAQQAIGHLVVEVTNRLIREGKWQGRPAHIV